MVFDFLQPVSDELMSYIASLSSQTLGRKAVFNTTKDFPNLENILNKIPFLGICYGM